MELVFFTGAVNKPNWFELDVFKIIQTVQLGYHCVEASRAQLAISRIHRTIVDDIVAGRRSTATFAFDAIRISYLHLNHLILSRIFS
jgi:hypothetical protein